EGKRRDDDADTDLETAASAPLGIETVGEFPKEIADGSEDAFLLNADGGIAEARSELERIDAVIVDDTVERDVADVALFRELGLHFQQSAVEECVGLAPEHGGAHFAGGRAYFTGKKFFVFEVDVDGSDKFFAVEETADGDFHAVHATLQLEYLDFFGESFFVGLKHADDVLAIFFLTDEQAALNVLGFAAGLDDIAIGIFFDEFDGRIEGIEILVRNDGDAGFFEFFLAEGAIIFEIVGVRSAANDGFTGSSQCLRFGALA